MDLVTRVEDLSDRIVLVGLTATGTQDIGSIPLYNEYARVGTYHNTINTIVQREFITRVNWPLNLILMLIIALAMGYVIKRLDAKRSLITMLVTFIVLNVAVMVLLRPAQHLAAAAGHRPFHVPPVPGHRGHQVHEGGEPEALHQERLFLLSLADRHRRDHQGPGIARAGR